MAESRDIIESILGKPSIFRSREKLYPEYVPPRLPHRSEQLAALATYFKPVITEPGSISQRVLIVGNIGTGKSVTARRFGIDFADSAKKRGLKLKYVHINCHRDRTLYFVVQEMARQLHIPIPSRGLSAQEMYHLILKQMEAKNLYAIVTLDEFDYFIEVAGNDAVYFLVRTYDEHPEYTKRVNFIFITRGLTSLSRLDAATESYLIRNVINFKPYTYEELKDILIYRASEAFYENTVGEDVIDYIAELVAVDKGGSGNARLALEILLLAGTEADNEGADSVTIEHVRKAFTKTNPNLSIMANDIIKHLPLHEMLVLLAAIRVLRYTNKAYVRIGEIEEEYARVCEEYGETPRRHTQVYEYVIDLKKRGIVDARLSGKGQRGRSTVVGISLGPLSHLEKYVTELIELMKGGRG